MPTKQVAIEFHDAVKSASDTHPVSKSSENLNDAQEKMKLVDLEGKQVDSKVTPKDVDLPAKEKVDVKESDKSGDSVKEDDTSETNSENVEVEDDQDEQVQDKVEQSSKKQRIDL